jgi:hypothetical protein
MGMDLIPKNNRVGSFMINWTGWRILDMALKELDCDAKLSFVNEGDYLTGEACKEIAHLIEQNISLLYECELNYQTPKTFKEIADLIRPNIPFFP